MTMAITMISVGIARTPSGSSMPALRKVRPAALILINKRGQSSGNKDATCHGGTGWSPVQRYIFDLECGRAGVATYNASGSHFVGPVIIHYGTPAQKDRYLPRIRSGEDYWAQGYSEPGSGSDLASLKTRAVADGDHYVVNGQKIWTTNAHRANRMFALVRTATTNAVMSALGQTEKTSH